MSCPERVHLFALYLTIFLLRVDLHGFNFSEHASLFTIILFRFLHCLLYPQNCLRLSFTHPQYSHSSQRNGVVGAGARKPNFHCLPMSSLKLQNYPCCNDLDFTVYCLLTSQIRLALGSLESKVLSKYLLLLLLS